MCSTYMYMYNEHIPHLGTDIKLSIGDTVNRLKIPTANVPDSVIHKHTRDTISWI